ncbi:MAG TPA: hypothetical protein VMF69_15060 [Gemmataceae bacterium]|nr:hypothetical protein [Gemmataceae bacterium]
MPVASAAIDIDSGMYEIDADKLKAGNGMRARFPQAQIWMARVGHRSVHRREEKEKKKGQRELAT